MLSFDCDYNNGAHPDVLRRLIETNDKRSGVYGFDEWTESAKRKIREACKDSQAQIWFLSGGTQTNATVVDSILHTFEGVVAVDTGHINVHEAGAIEFTEHKIINIPGNDGKMEAETLDRWMTEFLSDGNREHCVFPGMVYITFPTELGTLYTRHELSDLYGVCRKYNMPLYVDGARLGYGLMAEGNDITLPFLAKNCDVFYIGGTKIGALLGEAVVFTHQNANPHFFSIVKQHGALMAKGRAIGVQFDALFSDNLYLEISRNAIDKAMQMRRIFEKKGYHLWMDSPTNQQFVILSHAEMERLAKEVSFSTWVTYDDTHTVCRFVTSWATTQEEIDALRHVVMAD